MHRMWKRSGWGRGGYLGAEGAHFKDALHGEHGGEDEVQVAQNVHELLGSSLELNKGRQKHRWIGFRG